MPRASGTGGSNPPLSVWFSARNHEVAPSRVSGDPEPVRTAACEARCANPPLRIVLHKKPPIGSQQGLGGFRNREGASTIAPERQVTHAPKTERMTKRVVIGKGARMGDSVYSKTLCRSIAVGILVLLSTFALGGCRDATDTTTSTGEVTVTTGALSAASASPATRVAEAVGPTVVNIAIADAQGRPQGIGTGVIYKADGVIVTNNHVVVTEGDRPAAQIVVTLATGETLPATIVGRDPVSDLAVLKVNHSGLLAAHFLPDLSDLRVGDYAIAIGTPLGLEGTVTLGIISAVKREIQVPGQPGATDFLQTDAAISPGNSGGALVDAQGNVIGINAAGLQPQSGAQNIGFAIPSDLVIYVVEQILSQGRVAYGFLGVQSLELSPELRQQLNVDQDIQGVVILGIEPGSPANQAGLQPGDVVISMAGEAINNSADLFNARETLHPGVRSTWGSSETVSARHFRSQSARDQARMTRQGIERGSGGWAACCGQWRPTKTRGLCTSVVHAARDMERAVFREELEALSRRLDLGLHLVLRHPPVDWQGE